MVGRLRPDAAGTTVEAMLAEMALTGTLLKRLQTRRSRKLRVLRGLGSGQRDDRRHRQSELWSLVD